MKLSAALLFPLLASATHYGDPNVRPGCASDEEKVQITGLAGDICSPACDATTQACPTDVPEGVTAKPTCALKSSTGTDQRCALVCSATIDEASLRAGDAQCGEKASCKAIQGTGICTYDDVPVPPSSEHWAPINSPTFQEQSVVINVAFSADGTTGFAGAGQNNIGATIIKSTDSGKTWNVVWPSNTSKPGLDLWLASATKNKLEAVTSGVLNQAWTVTGGKFEPSVNLFASPSQDAQVLGGSGDFVLVGAFEKANGIATSKTGLEWTKFDMGINKTVFPARYGAFPSASVHYVTAGAFPSSNSNNEHPVNHRLSVLRDSMSYRLNTGKLDFSDPVSCDVDPTNCYSAKIMKTTDGGKTWASVYEDTTNNIYPNGIHCSSEEHCVAVVEGETCRILVTRDGGKTWNETMHDTDTASSLMASHMIDENEGWVAGGHLAPLDFEGRFWHTLDGGATWTKEAIKGLYIISFDLVSGTAGYSVGLTASSGVQLIGYKGKNSTKRVMTTFNKQLLAESQDNTTHYEDPKSGCQADELAVQITGVDGDFCSPKCTTTACPTDVPTGVTATPQCALSSASSTDKYCALICQPGANDDQCGTNASCKSIQGVGICTYDD